MVRQLNEIAKNYDDTPDLNGYMSRTSVIAKAKELQRALITPDQTPNYHGLNVGELDSSPLSRPQLLMKIKTLINRLQSW